MFHYVNETLTSDRVTTLLELGANPFWQDETGTPAIVKAALSDIEPRKKLRTLQAWQTMQVILGCEKTKTRINLIKQYDDIISCIYFLCLIFFKSCRISQGIRLRHMFR